MSTSALSLADLRAANIKRDREWNVGSEPVSLSFRGNELAGETGEACNILKKLERERLGIPGSRSTKEALADELADVVICADLTAMDLEIDLDAAVARKFNETSEKYGLATRLERPAAGPANTLVLLQGATRRALTHGGLRNSREFRLYLNDVKVRTYTEGSIYADWSYGDYFDRIVAQDVARFERALGCKVLRGREKSNV